MTKASASGHEIMEIISVAIGCMSWGMIRVKEQIAKVLETDKKDENKYS